MKKKLYKAFESATPDVMDKVLKACPAPEKGTTGERPAYETDWLWYRNALSTAAAVLLLVGVCGVGVWMLATGRQSAMVDTTDPTHHTQPTTEQTLPPETTEPTADTTLPPETTEPTPTETDPLPARVTIINNGNVVYVHSDTQLLRQDIRTGQTVVLAEFDRIVAADSEGPYLAAVTSDKIAIYQIVISTETVELLYSETSAQTISSWFCFSAQKTAGGSVVWEMVNPEAYAILEQEVRKLDSVLLNNRYVVENFLHLWTDPQKLKELPYDIYTSNLLQIVQEQFDVNALVRCSYDPTTKEYTEKEGIVDDCWFGSDIGHDHFALDETAKIIPTVIDTKVTSIEWVYNVPMKGAGQITHGDNGKYYTTAEGTVLWVDNEKNVTQIYQSQFGELKSLSYHEGKLCLVDGDHVVMLDLLESTCSVILYHPGSIWAYFDSDTELYVEITLGLDISCYIFNFETGALTETRYRL